MALFQVPTTVDYTATPRHHTSLVLNILLFQVSIENERGIQIQLYTILNFGTLYTDHFIMLLIFVGLEGSGGLGSSEGAIRNNGVMAY
jgi:hypothetical protein